MFYKYAAPTALGTAAPCPVLDLLIRLKKDGLHLLTRCGCFVFQRNPFNAKRATLHRHRAGKNCSPKMIQLLFWLRAHSAHNFKMKNALKTCMLKPWGAII
jgi:hypothetical protein